MTKVTNMTNILLLKIKHNHFINFFPFSIVEWNKLSREKEILKILEFSKKSFWSLLELQLIVFFDIYNPYGIKLLTRLRLGLRNLNEHNKFKHGFNDTIFVEVTLNR